MMGINLTRLLARFMHEQYELKSKEIGWQTQDDCQVDFEELPDKNKVVMMYVANEVISFMEDIKSDDKMLLKAFIDGMEKKFVKGFDDFSDSWTIKIEDYGKIKRKYYS